MLQNFRDNLKGITSGILVAIIIVPFAFFGIDSLFLQGSSVDEAARVNGEKITELRVLQAIENRKRQILAQYQDIDPRLLEDSQLRGPVTEAIIRQVVLAQSARDGGMGVSGNTFRDILLEAGAFQREGKFDRSLYEFTLGQMGYTPKTYRQLVEEELLANQLVSGVVESSFIPEQEVRFFAGATLQQRDFYYLTVPLDRYRNQVEVGEKEIAAYYDANPAEFSEPEKVSVEYLSLTPETLKTAVQVDDDLVREQFEQESQAADALTSWRVAHILVEDNAGAEKTLAEIKEKLARGEDFGALAKTYSQDFGTAEQGGDLGSFTAGALPENFEEAVAKLKPGEVSGVVTTGSGFHLIKLLSLSAPEPLVFEDHEARIREELAMQMAIDELPARVEELKEKSYNVETLETVGQAMGLAVAVTDLFPRAGGTGIASNPLVVNAAFSEDVLEKGYTSGVMELGENQYLVLKLKEHLAAHRKSLELVRDDIRERLVEDRAAELAAAQAAELLDRVRSGESVESVAVGEELEWQVALETTRFDASVNPALARAVFEYPAHSSVPVSERVALPNGDVAVYQLTAIRAGELEQLSAEERKNLVQSLEQVTASREWQALEQGLMSRAEVARK